MSSSGRYQSRLFNFVHQQSRRLTQQCDRVFHNFQVSASWVATVGLLPLLRIFQSSSAAKQLHQTVKQSFPQLPADDIDTQSSTLPTVDTPIQQVLLLVDALSSEEAVLTPLSENTEPTNNPMTRLVAGLRRLKIVSQHPVGKRGQGGQGRQGRQGGQGGQGTTYHFLTTPYSLLPTPSIRGIATQLSSRTLVLVTAQNEVLDILPSWQQQKLQQQIIAAVADYWRYQRLHSLGQHGSSQPSQKIKDNRQKNSQLARHSPFTASFFLAPHSVVAFLDRIIAKVESNYLIPVSAAKTNPTQSAYTSKLSFANTLGDRNRQLIQRLQTGLSTALSGGESPAITPDAGSETYTLKIQALIWAAIDYFFGTGSRKQLEQTAPKSDSKYNRSTQNLVGRSDLSLHSTSSHLQGKQLPQRRSATKAQLPTHSRSVDPNLADPWLSESDLFGDSSVAADKSATEYQPEQSRPRIIKSRTKKTSLALPSKQSAGYFLQDLVNSLRKFLPQAKPADEIVKRQKINTGKVIGITKQSPSVVKSPQQAKAGEVSTQTSAHTQMQPTPDWIETNATVMGYVKHPLEQLLGWLDRAMLWLEEFWLKVWQWLQQLWQSQGK